METISRILTNEPVLVRAVVQAVIGLLIAFGVDLTNEQVAAVLAFTAALTALTISARSKVTPVAKQD